MDYPKQRRVLKATPTFSTSFSIGAYLLVQILKVGQEYVATYFVKQVFLSVPHSHYELFKVVDEIL